MGIEPTLLIGKLKFMGLMSKNLDLGSVEIRK